jgi:hypothetical protein
VSIKSYKWGHWFFAIAVLICIKVLLYFGFDGGSIYQSLFFGFLIVFFSALLYFAIKFKLSEKRARESSARVDEGLRELERITKE